MAQSVADVMQDLDSYRMQRISVVTKKDNRFQGVLKEIRTATQSICMEKVRFCGTEYRGAIGSFQPARMELISDVTFRLGEIKEIFAHIERSPEMCMDPAVIDSGDAITPILWSTVRLSSNKEAYVLPTPPDQRVIQRYSRTDENPLLNIPAAVRLLEEQAGRSEKPQVSVISAGNIRYEGTLKNVDQITKSVCVTDVRFFGTEDRPAVKLVVPREEKYPSVKFQLDQLKYIRINVAMCQDMFEDTAVMVDQSSHGIIEINAECPLPTALQNGPAMPPRNASEPDSTNLSNSAQSVGNGSGTSAVSVNQRRSRVHFQESSRGVSPRTTRCVSQPRSPLTSSTARALSQQPMPVIADANSTRQRCSSVINLLKTVRLTRRGRGRPSSSGRQGGILKNATTSFSAPSAAEVFSEAGRSSSEVDGDGGRGKRGKASRENACPEMETAAGETVFLDVIWNGKFVECPAENCTWKASNLYIMKCHFEKMHAEQYPTHQLRLHCILCPESGFRGMIPMIRKHMESVHYWKDGYPHDDTAPDGNAVEEPSGEEAMPPALPV